MLEPLGLGPRVYAADIARGFCLLEDLGEGETLAERLIAEDPTAATSALFAYARSLGDLHAATSGNAARWSALLAERGSEGGDVGPTAIPWRQAELDLPAFCSDLGIAPPPGLTADTLAIRSALDQPGDYLAFTPADCCPDNNLLRGERVVFFDCESAAMRHALLDACYFLAPFPTCWCAAALPDGLPQRLLAAYQERFAGGPDFDDQLTLVLAGWLVERLITRRLTNWLENDAPWGLSTTRQRVMALIKQLLARPNLATLLPCLAAVASELERQLSARWPDLPPMPLYPAFR